MVVIDVNLGKEKGKQKLVIYPGDCPNKASIEFGEKHCKIIDMIVLELAGNKTAMLEKMLR